MTKKQKKSLQQILIALALVILLKLLLRVLPALPTPVELLLYLIPYFVVGKDVLRKAIKGVKNRQPFDECFQPDGHPPGLRQRGGRERQTGAGGPR